MNDVNIKTNVEVSIHGNGFFFDKSKSDLALKKESNDTTEKKKNPPTSKYEKKLKLRNKSVTRFITKFHSCSSIPTLAISLSVPRVECPFESVEEEKKYYHRFMRLINREYPKSWFFTKFEWSPIAKLHIHLVGSLGTNDDSNPIHANG